MLLLPAWTAKWCAALLLAFAAVFRVDACACSLICATFSACRLPWRTFLWAMSRLRRGKTDVSMEQARERTKKLANLSDQLEEQAGVFYFAPAHKYEYSGAVASRDAAPFFGAYPAPRAAPC